MKKLLVKKQKGFTLVEMLVVLGIISILLLLFVPNLSKQKEVVKETGNEAVVKVVESQKNIYELKYGETPSTSELVSKGYITTEQAKAYDKVPATQVNE